MEGINGIMLEQAGLGETGETYLVGEDKLMRSDSRFEADTIMSKTIDTETVNLALEGKAGTTEIMDYRNKLVISSYDEVDVLGTHWAIIAEIDDAEVAAGAVRLRNNAMIIFGVSALLLQL